MKKLSVFTLMSLLLACQAVSAEDNVTAANDTQSRQAVPSANAAFNATAQSSGAEGASVNTDQAFNDRARTNAAATAAAQPAKPAPRRLLSLNRTAMKRPAGSTNRAAASPSSTRVDADTRLLGVIVDVDARNNRVTVKDHRGDKRTLQIEGSNQLMNLRRGDSVEVQLIAQNSLTASSIAKI